MAAVIRVGAIWLSTELLDMRAGAERTLTRVVAVVSVVRPHHAHCFANRHANRMKVLMHDGIGVWPAAHRLNFGKFTWADAIHGPHVVMDAEQWQALVLGPRWQQVGAAAMISVL